MRGYLNFRLITFCKNHEAEPIDLVQENFSSDDHMEFKMLPRGH